MINETQRSMLVGSPVWGTDGGLIGTVTAVHEVSDGEVEFATVRLSGLRRRCVPVPLAGADFGGVRVLVPYPRRQVQAAPTVSAGWSAEARQAAQAHYGLNSAALLPPESPQAA